MRTGVSDPSVWSDQTGKEMILATKYTDDPKTVILEHGVFGLFERDVIIEHVKLGFH